ncbi:bifunctional 4-hydroxy-2-oxoglutarate aldolase/2-dehydro-3-deoxy-phosphogluconate aldolase [Neobacillus sedimentimangrovi]|uniref:Bifunctional 4-hydroxy-2-oxoglutarate aldolase/2-dehydro-3-deoxy-phosphogluconate aldolase n=1 Tax=Neobacillus sedimentimangrovi TaxID=2699460 RepID=A0ABS8QLW0_9BACI|nr:bifunctional 4-hydroxy-2-oxoglutarate aldolase/2-dehydro-3-deoxy-phosphogluconate aldolase [Neobacillus sedimentimangrovi]AIM16280.1 2-dehydro-3-deoxyphosphogluconate aldolase [Bacillus sp. X1(2014)]MCD4840232.1 bifunctional 4-hydroxy-2-oxoglutarate aldolase/2-dehydro-3-deoxy-phosphogluconate aldolase [Neobacillus sedimentimangrovi]
MGVEEIQKRRVVAVIRGATMETIIPVAQALKNGGITAIEITMETPKALSIIERVADVFGDEMFVGAGTVLDPETARAAILSGAKFVFSPTVRKETIEMTKRYGIISVPGAFTATEILTAYEYGADVVKVFPAGSVGPSYFKNLAGPLPHIPLMPTGGINTENAKDYIRAGAVAVGVGSSLVDPTKELTEPYLRSITEKAQQLMMEVQFVQKV